MIQSQENDTYLEITIPPNKTKERLDKFLSREIGKDLSRSRIQQLIEAGEVLIDEKRVKPSHKVLPGEIVQIHITRPKPPEAKPEPIPLDVTYEDDFLLIVNKPPGMVVHPAYGNYTGTLVNALLYYCNSLSKTNDELRPGIVHRLDKNTSGLIVVAKDDITHRKLAYQFYHRQVDKIYQAIVWGIFKKQTGTIEAPIGRSKRDRKKMTIAEDGKPSITHYKVLKTYDFLSLISLKLETGRTHQIRVHLASIGHPVFGDETYGGRRQPFTQLNNTQRAKAAHLLNEMPRHALHAKELQFTHPMTKEKLSFHSELPEDINRLLEQLNNLDEII